MGLLQYVRQDFVAPRASGGRAPRPFTVRGFALVLYRTSQYIGRTYGLAGDLLKQANHIVTGADLAWQSEAGPGLFLAHPTGVVIGQGVVMGAGVRIYSGVTLGGRGGGRPGHPRIGNDVVLGAGCKILGPIALGNEAKVGANAVVLGDVPVGGTATGVPAKVSHGPAAVTDREP